MRTGWGRVCRQGEVGLGKLQFVFRAANGSLTLISKTLSKTITLGPVNSDAYALLRTNRFKLKEPILPPPLPPPHSLPLSACSSNYLLVMKLMYYGDRSRNYLIFFPFQSLLGYLWIARTRGSRTTSYLSKSRTYQRKDYYANILLSECIFEFVHRFQNSFCRDGWFNHLVFWQHLKMSVCTTDSEWEQESKP